MAIRRLVTIEQLPEITTEDQGRRFLGKIQDRMSDRRPGLVLDCSGAKSNGQASSSLASVLPGRSHETQWGRQARSSISVGPGNA